MNGSSVSGIKGIFKFSVIASKKEDKEDIAAIEIYNLPLCDHLDTTSIFWTNYLEF